MARTALLVKAARKPKFITRTQRRCWRCGRGRSVMRKFKMCRICFRELVSKGEVPGFTRASW